MRSSLKSLHRSTAAAAASEAGLVSARQARPHPHLARQIHVPSSTMACAAAAATTPADRFVHSYRGPHAHDAFFSREQRRTNQHQRRWLSATPKGATAPRSLSSMEREAEAEAGSTDSPSALAAARTNLGLYAELSKVGFRGL